MKVLILAGGFGTRLGEYTDTIPKPMVTIGGRPILHHVMETFARYSLKDFIIALGYKSNVIKEYFSNYRRLNSDFSVDLLTGKLTYHASNVPNWNVTVVDTGLNTMTGGRLKRLRDFVSNDTFLLTYGDSLANVNISKLLEFHRGHGKMVTVTAVRPAARFGELTLDGDTVTKFIEKPQTNSGWINGGYFVIEPSFLDLIDNDSTVLEKEPLESCASAGQLVAYRHHDFWQCMDTRRDRELLEEWCTSGRMPWLL